MMRVRPPVRFWTRRMHSMCAVVFCMPKRPKNARRPPLSIHGTIILMCGFSAGLMSAGSTSKPCDGASLILACRNSS